ncbi:NADH-FMN oxidoreductase RutF, flavin reductase (DIM6/NTAB) family [Alteribacillus persepolensis]|uniref:NADH-FMN oxidoreductase RutF, flavin reductase (DIM6/NTAB) family n=1 Tax=Alteribacillus persepolensis TaxID=568899 RepID=A0A1G8J8I8_9BACI|nr:flavin reductase family protein [Alteribacillus persepolensis]SDI27297.1 NADH-FMN oxidoreductase RutF, flavin reductase (DIM6/NTAB) family [Alteribacillus persepolensis]
MQTKDKETLFKEAMGGYPTGVTIVTSKNEKGEPVGLTVNSFASVSIDPLLVLWSIDHKVSSLGAFKNADGFAVHILAGDQQELCKTFATKDTNRFSLHEWSISKHNLPVLADTFSVLQCKTFKQVEAGDHTILIGEVQDIQITKDKEPMLYHRRNFGFIPSEFYTN